MLKNKDKKFYITWEISLKWIHFWQYRQELYLESSQKSMVDLFCKNSEQLFAVNFFCKKAPP